MIDEFPIHDDSDNVGLSADQVSAILYKKQCARSLAGTYPEIAEDYEVGLTHRQIAEKYNVNILFDCELDFASKIVMEALHLLLSAKELKRIFQKHLSEKRARGGQATFDRDLGFFGLSDEERAAGIAAGLAASEIYAAKKSGIASLGGQTARDMGVGVHGMTTEEHRAAGRKSRDMGVGVHGLTPEQRREIGLDTVRKKIGIHAQTPEKRSEAGKLRALSIGRLPWNDAVSPKVGMDEGDYCIHLSNDPNYQHQTGSSAGRPDAQKIADRVNEVFGNDRLPRAVTNHIYRHRKKIKKTLEE